MGVMGRIKPTPTIPPNYGRLTKQNLKRLSGLPPDPADVARPSDRPDSCDHAGGDNPYIALTVVFMGCIAMDTMITNVASAVFMFPIGMAIASNLGVNGMPFVITVLVGASCSFISPMGYQTNLMVFGPGGYKFIDFVKIGVPMTVVVGVITIFLAPVVWPF